MVKEFEPPTYEQYLKATQFAKFKYKYGLLVQIISIFLLILLIIFVWNYGEEMARYPLTYAADKTNTYCTCTFKDTGEMVYVNATHIIKSGMIFGGNNNIN